MQYLRHTAFQLSPWKYRSCKLFRITSFYPLYFEEIEFLLSKSYLQKRLTNIVHKSRICSMAECLLQGGGEARECRGNVKWMVGLNKRVSAKGEIESHGLACSFGNCAHDSSGAQNGCAVPGSQRPLLSNEDKDTKETESERETNNQWREIA